MKLVTPALLQRLGRSRLEVRRAVPNKGVGERRSRAKGQGMEFADHRPYALGDDTRHLDRHVYARLGQHVVKQYSVYQQLSVTILVDGTASMSHGSPRTKYDMARALGAVLAYVALVGGDRVLVGVFSGRGLTWYRWLQGPRRAGALFEWLERVEPNGACTVAEAVRRARPRLHSGGLTIAISDWLTDASQQALRALVAAAQEVLAVHVLAPEELDPSLLGSGAVRFLDRETGNEAEAVLDVDLFERYERELEQWLTSMREQVRGVEGRYAFVRSDADVESVVLHDWRDSGLVR